ncbi:MAG: DUF485 domain-containing protein [Acidobacteria bacterium]|nr:MAG: DUF485 domain-containing protein [Acidobacteriota bacterium]
MNPTRRALLDSVEFQHLVANRWRVSLALSVLLFVLYYGYIILIAANRALLSRRIGEVTTLGIPLGAAVIVGAWLLTAVYVIWANRYYDAEAARLRARAGDG